MSAHMIVGGCGNRSGRKAAFPRGVWGHAPQKILKSRSSEIQFPAFWASKLGKTMTSIYQQKEQLFLIFTRLVLKSKAIK